MTPSLPIAISPPLIKTPRISCIIVGLQGIKARGSNSPRPSNTIVSLSTRPEPCRQDRKNKIEIHDHTVLGATHIDRQIGLPKSCLVYWDFYITLVNNKTEACWWILISSMVKKVTSLISHKYLVLFVLFGSVLLGKTLVKAIYKISWSLRNSLLFLTNCKVSEWTVEFICINFCLYRYQTLWLSV